MEIEIQNKREREAKKSLGETKEIVPTADKKIGRRAQM